MFAVLDLEIEMDNSGIVLHRKIPIKELFKYSDKCTAGNLIYHDWTTWNITLCIRNTITV